MTKLKYRKIRNVPREVCTCEQKIAYNFAWLYYHDLKKMYEIAPSQMDKMDIIRWAVNRCIEKCQEDKTIMNKYNIDAIISALRAGLENYISGTHYILTTYEEIGEMFPAYYL